MVLDRGPFIHPLLELLDEGAPAGVVLASRTEARLLEWRLGELTPLREMQAEVPEPRHERSGPVGSRPASRYGTPTGEQRNARERDQAARFIERVAAAASRLARERGWKRILVSGGEQQPTARRGAAARAARDGAARSSRAGGLDLATLEDIVTERVRAAHAEFEHRLIPRSASRRTAPVPRPSASPRSSARSTRPGSPTSSTTRSIRYRGSVGHDGSLYAEDETALTHGSTADQRLTERIVERALETGARVTPVEGAATDGLAEAIGIAAVLRW